MKKYVKIMRLDHWIKQLFIVPGILIAMMLLNMKITFALFLKIVLGLLATCFISSSNYVINEWLDAKFDKYHPIKKNRVVVQNNLNPFIVYSMYIILALIGLILSSFINKFFFISEFVLFIMGILYNVKPFRLKDMVYIDALSESINNALRFLMGWFVVTDSYFPTISIVLGYWMAGAFLMEIKRYSEFCMIGDAEVASKYRKSFKYYTDKSLLILSFFYAMCSVFFVGVFLIKYKIELIFFIPFYIVLFCYYFYISLRDNSIAQKPECLYKEKGLMIYILFLLILFIILLKVDLSFLDLFINNNLIPIK